MIDIIIPAYNAHETIIETLSSIAIQTYRDKVKVYIVDDNSDKDYKKEISIFKNKLDITYLKTDKNRGPGYARQYALDNSNGEYIVFMDADDQLYNSYAIEILYNKINNEGLDVVMGYFYVERENLENHELPTMQLIGGCLHGKIYRRKHLVDNNIRFNNSRYSEDNSFNGLAINTTEKVIITEDILYVYRNTQNSLTRDTKKLVKKYTSYLHNILWLILSLKKRNFPEDSLIIILANCYTYVYSEVKYFKDVDFSKLYRDCFKFEEIFSEYEKYTSDDYIKQCLNGHISHNQVLSDYVLEDFNNFRKKFKRNQVSIDD